MTKRKDMTLIELQGILGDRIKVTLKDDMTPEERQVENEQSALIMGIAKQMINNADLVLRFEKLQAQTKNLKQSRMNNIIGDI
jgi:hypothetical protein